jgi:hypothetical protein
VNHPERLFLEPECTTRFPLPLPDPANARIHRVVVALGASSRIESHFGGNSRGSLMLASWIRGDDHVTGSHQSMPFPVGHVDPLKGFVHVFDDVTLDIIMSELDTISDFVQYLDNKENLFLRYSEMHCAGEEDFLGFYLDNLNPAGEFLPKAVNDAMSSGSRIFIAEGIWDSFLNGPCAAMRREVKAASQFIDELIEHFTGHVLAGTLAYGNEEELGTHERNLRFLASEPREHRAYLASMISQKMEVSRPNRRTSIVLPSSRPDRLYVFLLLPRNVGQSERAYRLERQAAMTAYCHVAKHMKPNVRYVICLATQPGTPHLRRSEDLMSFDFNTWTEEDDQKAAAVQRDLNILTTIATKTLAEPLEFWTPEQDGNRSARRRARAMARRRTPSPS